jgi:hypothetical protein
MIVDRLEAIAAGTGRSEQVAMRRVRTDDQGLAPVMDQRWPSTVRDTACPPPLYLGRYQEWLPIFVDRQLEALHQKLPLYIDPPCEANS